MRLGNVVEEMPDETYIGVNTSPAKLKDPEHICTKNIQRQRDRLKVYLTDCLKKGIESGECNKVPITEMVALLIALIWGLGSFIVGMLIAYIRSLVLYP